MMRTRAASPAVLAAPDLLAVSSGVNPSGGLVLLAGVDNASSPSQQ